jgi:hypothetical protein
MNKEQQEIIDEAYENYEKEYNKNNFVSVSIRLADGKFTTRKIDKEQFINLCIHDKILSKIWGLKIEERELSLKEKSLWLKNNKDYDFPLNNLDDDHIVDIIENNAPTKLITVTKITKIESYE